MKKITNFRDFAIFLSWFIPVVYFFIAFLPLPEGGITTGLDPSWTYAISRTAADGLIFGKDIIFTYGPLGYLVAGAPLEQNLFLITAFSLTVYSALFIIAIIKIATLETTLQKLSLTFSLLFAFLLGWLSTDYQVLFIFLLILSFDNLLKKSLRCWSLGLGAFAGFCLLTKFTLGIYTLGSLTLFLLGHLYLSVKSNSGVTRSIFALINALLAAISVSFIFLSPAYYLPNFYKIIILLAVSIVSGVGFELIQKKRVRRSLSSVDESVDEEVTSKKRLIGLSNIKLVSWCIFYIVYSLLLLTTIFHSFPSLIDYLKNSLEVSSGYSSAMSFISPRHRFNSLTLFFAISEFIFDINSFNFIS